MTTNAIFEEVRHIKPAALDGLLQAGNLQILDPDEKSIKAISTAAKKTGDIVKLSAADVSVLALALEHKIPLASDDYAVANVAAILGVKVVASSGKGIREIRRHITYCSACSKIFPPGKQECPLCGNRLRKRYKKVNLAQ